MRWLLLVAAALVLAGCGSPRQRAAEDALAARVGENVDVSCTRSAHVGYFRELKTKEFLCLAQRGSDTCDRYVVRLVGRRFEVHLAQRDADCVLPAS